MMKLKLWIKCAILSVLFLPALSYAQSYRSQFIGSGLRSMNGFGGFGFAEFDIKDPSSQFSMDNGVFVYVGGERRITNDGMFLTLSFNYMKASGESAYNFSNLAGNSNFTGSNIGFDAQNYQLGLGIRQKFFPNDWFRPYIEGGGLFGFFDLDHKASAGDLTCTGTCSDPNAFKKKDTLAGFGYYFEAGVEVDFSNNYGVSVGGKYQYTETREFETLNDQKLKFTTLVFQFAVRRSF